MSDDFIVALAGAWTQFIIHWLLPFIDSGFGAVFR